MTPEYLAELIDSLAGLPYGGEAVDQRTHALQCAWHAMRDGAHDELVLAAALHDIGRAGPVGTKYPGLPHELAGAAFVARHVGERSAWLVAQHVPAKRYLVATDPAYGGGLSRASVASLQAQGGPMTEREAAAFAAHPNADDAVRLRRWDDAAKDPGGPVLDISHVFDAYARVTQGRDSPGVNHRRP